MARLNKWDWISKSQLLNYMVDVLGYSEDEVKDLMVYSGPSELLTQQQFRDCIDFNK